jgi:LysR family positive regulator for ilvC
MDLKSLQVFLSVSGNLSFTQTASELHMSVSAVSRTIQRLEEDLGCRLFERSRRSMAPTSAAASLRTVAEKTLLDWRDLQRSLGAGATLVGDLRVFCSVTATHQLLLPLLTAYRDACPGVNVRLQTGDQADGVERVRQGAADIAVIALPEQLPDALDFLPLTESPLRLCLPSVDCAVTRTLADVPADQLLQALRDLPWILPERGVSKDAIETWLDSELGGRPSVYARVAGHEAIAAMISLGLGVGILPELVVSASGVATTLDLHAVPALDSILVGLCARKSRLDDPVVSSLWDVARRKRDE